MHRWDIPVSDISFSRKLHQHGIIDQQLTCNLIISSMSCHYHTSSWNGIDYTGCDLTQFRYHVKVFPKSGLAVDSNCRVNKNVANVWRRLKRITGSRFLRLIYCYAIYFVLVCWNAGIFIYVACYPEANISVYKTQSESPTFSSFILVHRLLIYFVSTLILRTMLPLPILLCIFCTRVLQ